MSQTERVAAALDMARDYGQSDGAHHKAWVIDQMVRCLLGPLYDRWVQEYSTAEDGETGIYEWDTGIAP